MENKIDPALPALSDENEWSLGCERCAFGLIDPPAVQLAIPLYIVRTFFYEFGVMVVCDCRAGQAYERRLKATWAAIMADDEIIPATWSTAIHKEINRLLQPPVMTMSEPAAQ